MRATLAMLCLSASLSCLVAAGEDGPLKVYGDVPGLTPSGKYSFRVRPAGANDGWQDAFAFITTCKQGVKGKNAYFGRLSGWTNTYINFEMAAPVEIEIRKATGAPIQKAVVHPRRKARSCILRDGKAYVVLDKSCLVTVDIDGQMDDQDTGKTKKGRYAGPPIHTLTIFANPPIVERPQPGDPDVHAVKPGEPPPARVPGRRSTSCPACTTSVWRSPYTPTAATTSPATPSSTGP